MQVDNADWWDRALVVMENDPSLSQSNLAFIRLATPLANLNGIALLAVADKYSQEVLENRVYQTVLNALKKVDSSIKDLAITLQPALQVGEPQTATNTEDNLPTVTTRLPSPNAVSPTNQNNPTSPAVFSTGTVPTTSTSEENSNSKSNPPAATNNEHHLNAKYTFESFVIGPSNRFAHAAARAVAETPARAYNPLFIYGGSGLGKTHLLHAIGHYAMNLYPGTKVRYVNSEEFTNDFINSVSAGKAHEFQLRYRNIDILLIDDIQFLQGKEQTVEEFFHTFNSLHNDNKQVVITSDLPPKKLDGFEERLRSRFEWGLTTDVQPPDLETRMAILRNKTRYEGYQANDDVLAYIASRFQMNIRELEGALVRVTAFASLTNQEVSLPIAELVLKDIISSPNAAQITAGLVKTETAKYFEVTVEQLCSSTRNRAVTEARQSAMYVCRELTDLSLPQIGKEFGGRDHTTVMHANRKIAQAMNSDQKTFTQITELTNRIRQAARQGEI